MGKRVRVIDEERTVRGVKLKICWKVRKLLLAVHVRIKQGQRLKIKIIPRKGYRKKNGKRDSSLLSGSNRVFSVSCNEKINLKPNSERSQENEMLQIREQSWPALEAYFGRAKAAFLCSYCYKRDLWFYDGGRLGRVKIVTLRIGANLKHFHLSSGVSTWRVFSSKNIGAPEETPAQQAIGESWTYNESKSLVCAAHRC